MLAVWQTFYRNLRFFQRTLNIIRNALCTWSGEKHGFAVVTIGQGFVGLIMGDETTGFCGSSVIGPVLGHFLICEDFAKASLAEKF